MADYAIGDVQGCFEPLQRLLDYIHFDDQQDQLWLVGDLINRGPQSLQVLRFVKSLPITPIITLGNHDLYFLSTHFSENPQYAHDDTLQELRKATDCDELAHWLRKQRLLHYDQNLNFVMTHAGIAPTWNLEQAMSFASELESVLSGDNYRDFLLHMFGNDPNYWSSCLTGMTRLRVICNYFTRMRFCDENGRLDFSYKGTIANAPKHLYPWYDVPSRHEIPADIVFGHWAALKAKCTHPRIHAIDSGCLWHGELTALRLQDKQRFSVTGLQ